MYSGTVPAQTTFSIVTNGSTVTSTTTSVSNSVWLTNGTATTTNQQPVPMPMYMMPDRIKLNVGHARTITFPDGTIIDFAADGSFKIQDENAKVIYKAARCHDFNPFLNASDKLEEFIQFCGTVGIRQGDMLEIPIRSFVQWLVIEAAKADGDEPKALLELPNYSIPRCRSCGRFMSPQLKADRIEFCRAECLETKLNSHRRKNHGQASRTIEAAAAEATVPFGT